MPDAATARNATGYERGTITPFGSTRPWPVIADERIRGRVITLGTGEHGVAVAVDADEVVRATGASVADVTEPEPASPYARCGPAMRSMKRSMASRRSFPLPRVRSDTMNSDTPISA